MNYFKDYYARWEFEGYHGSLEFSEFSNLSPEKMKNLAFSRIGNLKIILNFLLEHEIFIPEFIYINSKKNQIESSKMNNYFQSILEIVEEQGLNNSAFSLEGRTLIMDKEEYLYYSNIINVNFDFVFDTIIIESTSDIWQPMDIHGGDLNIERALINSDRLEKCLFEIKREGIFKNIEPDEGKDERDVCAQHGFRMYYEEWAFKEFYPEVDIEKFDKFIWERRNVSDQ